MGHVARGYGGELARTEILEGLDDLFARVHDEGAVTGDGFADGEAAEDKDVPLVLLGCSLDVAGADVEAAGAKPGERMITYCGGGIAASSTAFAAVMAGYGDVALYDASLSEWAADESLPMVVEV